ncbi:PepSY-associated TM helix domain-containing protein [Sphingobium sp. HBC34]|uniref:PepSY-associated TM helix domain-containing protein n=1 Tax=Sphingobium cyanobacteriorum TaxID=3063954 RepID=A0ABT8ZP06_9SPHN|nr:PepSY-associated TM helix domain-containing protein [Sphingobium sp. HBC34]MDO7836267.1 PepSY-associated TM helix domain-containing protein [Sphingobium sp. HBC34]
MRAILVQLHRYVGLSVAVFLMIAGLTGSILAFQSEIDAVLNPRLFRVENPGRPLPLSTLVSRVETAMPGASVRGVTLPTDAGGSIHVSLAAVGQKQLDQDEIFVDGATGQILGGRLWGAARVDRPHLIPFIYRLHYSLHMPGSWGVWLMGGVALAWMLDCFVGFYLTLPRGTQFWKKWRPIWKIKRGAGHYRLNLDVHRAFGLWLWAALFLLALTSVAFNLNTQIFRPVLTALLPMSPSIWDRSSLPLPPPVRVGWDQATTLARAEAVRLDWPHRPVQRIALAREAGFYQVRFGNRHQAGFGTWALYVATTSGHIIGAERGGDGQAGDIVDALIYPIHSGQIAGLPGRILICLTGLVVAMLSVTGVYIWWKKRAPRAARRHHERSKGPSTQAEAIHAAE